MKTLYLSVTQGKSLAEDLLEYESMKDTSERPLFKGFEVRFGDPFLEGVQDDQTLEMTPIPQFTVIEGSVTE